MVIPPRGARSSINVPVTDALVDVVVLSHLRWDFVFQRPQHLMTRCARAHRVFFVEEPVEAGGPPRLDVQVRHDGVRVVVPRLPAGIAPREAAALQSELLRDFFEVSGIHRYLLWYYTPMA